MRRDRPQALALFNPACDWVQSHAGYAAVAGDLLLRAYRYRGVWVGEIRQAGREDVVQAGGSRNWDESDARRFCERQAQRILRQRKEAER